MTNKKTINKLTFREFLIAFLFIAFGVAFVLFIWNDINKQEHEKVLQNAQSIAASLPKEELISLPEMPEALRGKDFSQLKKALREVIHVNKNARFAYLYVQRNDKLYFIVDSEPESSPGYSGPGQEYTEASSIDRKPFQDGKAFVTDAATDRWGTWVSAEVPVTNKETGKVIAVFGMDYNAKSWRNRVLFEVSESVILVLIVLFLLFVSRRSMLKNALLKKEITQREEAEQALKKSESHYRQLFELNPQPMFVYDLESMFILEVNRAAIKTYGYTDEEFLSRTIIDLKASEDFLRLWKNLIEDPNAFQHTEVWNHQTKDGRIIQVEVHSHNLDFRHKNARLVLLIDITKKRLSEEKLRQTEANFKRSIEESPFGVRIISDEGQTIFANPSLLSIFGFESLNDFNQIPATNWYTPQSYSEHMEREEKRKSKVPVESEYEISIIRNNQEIRYLQVFRSEILWNSEEKVQIIYLDITERKLAEDKLCTLSQAIEQNPVSVVITNPEGIIEYVNPRFTEMTGYEAYEAIGKNPRILKSGKMDTEFYSNLWETISSGEMWKGEVINKNKAGELYWANKLISPILDSQKRITHFVAIGEEITEKKRIESELIFAKEKAEISDRLKSSFLANISHEIRTPMNGILGFTDLLKMPDLSMENQMEFIEMIENSGQRLLCIINDLIDISKIEAGETNLKIRKTNINKMLHDLHLFFLPQGNQKNVNIDYHCGLQEEESTIEIDGTKLNQILTNLLKNALKFTKVGSISFGYDKKTTGLEFYVTDTGPGIATEQKNLIFERFRQADHGLTRQYEGIGLGLTISKAYIEQLGGSISLETELGKGSTFSFELPYLPLATG